MIEVCFKPSFVRQAKRLDKELFDEVLEKIEQFRDKNNHKKLGIHKLHGPLAGKWSFSVNYKIRIVFEYENPTTAVLLAIGNHSIYD